MQLPDQQTNEITDFVAMGQDGRVRYTRKQLERVNGVRFGDEIKRFFHDF
jgi:hypothetical protein